MNPLTLFKRPSRLVFLDDDTFFLQVLKVALPQLWRADLFLDSKACLVHLKANGQSLIQDFYAQQSLLEKSKEDSQSGHSLIPSIVKYWHKNPSRYNLVHLATFDYGMPGLNGLDAFEQIGNWPGRRVLLTGQADDKLAVSAFNKGLIHQFIAKQGGDLRQSLLYQLPSLLTQPLSQYQTLWMQSLTIKQQRWLSELSVIESLNNWLQQTEWVEYVVTNAPFGLLGADAAGVLSWLQLTPQSELAALADGALSQGLDARGVEKVKSGVSLVNLSLRLALNDGAPLARSAAIKIGSNRQQVEQLGEQPEDLLGALWLLGDRYNLPADESFSAWRDKHPTQIIE